MNGAFYLGLFLTTGSARDGVLDTVNTMIEAVTECVAAFFCAVSVNLDDGAAAHILLVVDTVANAAFELGHDGFSFLVFMDFLRCFLTAFTTIICTVAAIIPNVIEQVFDIIKNAIFRTKKGRNSPKKFIKNYCIFTDILV